MAEYIEREALLAELGKGTIIPDDLYSMGIMAGVDAAMKKIASAPAADVVEVVRCEDCRWSCLDGWFCGGAGAMPEHTTTPNRFCHWGDRRENNG